MRRDYAYSDFLREYGPDYEEYNNFSFEQYCDENNLTPVYDV